MAEFVRRPRARFDVVGEISADEARALLDRCGVADKVIEKMPEIRVSQPRDIFRAFVVTRGNPDVKEVHILMSNAEVWVVAPQKATLVTVLFARPGQVLRYFPMDVRVDESVMNHARNNVASGKNES